MCAWGAFLVTVPSAVWRVLMILGLLPGTAELRAFELAENPALGYAYVVGLSVVQLTASFLTVGLTRRWGERLFGVRVPLIPVVVVATVGGLTVFWLFDVQMVGAIASGLRPDAGLLHGGALALLVVCYVPILLWAPLELARVVGYWRRRRRVMTTL